MVNHQSLFLTIKCMAKKIQDSKYIAAYRSDDFSIVKKVGYDSVDEFWESPEIIFIEQKGKPQLALKRIPTTPKVGWEEYSFKSNDGQVMTECFPSLYGAPEKIKRGKITWTLMQEAVTKTVFENQRRSGGNYKMGTIPVIPELQAHFDNIASRTPKKTGVEKIDRQPWMQKPQFGKF